MLSIYSYSQWYVSTCFLCVWMHVWMCVHSHVEHVSVSEVLFLTERGGAGGWHQKGEKWLHYWPVILKVLAWLSTLSDLADVCHIFNRAQRDFFWRVLPACSKENDISYSLCVCTYISILRVKKRALIFKGFYSPIAGQDLAPYGGFMQIWDRCLIAWTMESWLKQFLNVLSVETQCLANECWHNLWKKMYFSRNYWGANNHAHRHTELLRLLYLFKIQTPCTLTTQISWRDPLEVHFKSVRKIWSSPYFCTFSL